MAWTGLVLTNDGRIALNRAQVDGKMKIRSIIVGDGEAPQNFSSQKKLVHQLYEIMAIQIIQNDKKCMVIGDFPVVDYDYYFREIGIVVETAKGDILYVYDNCGNDAQYIVSTTGTEKTQKRLRLSINISDVESITISEPSVLYVDYSEFEQEVSRAQLSELELNEKIKEESERATVAENKLNSVLTLEVQRAQASEKTNENNIIKEIARAKEAEDTLKENLMAEVYRAESAEKVIADNLASEIAKSRVAEKTNANAISVETARAKGAEKANADAITTEVSRANTAEKANAVAIAAEANRAKAKEDTLSKNISTETTRATTAEKKNADAISAEASRAKTAEASITQTIQTNKPVWEDKYTKNEIDNKFSTLEMATDWKESVAGYSNIASTYPNPQDGWTVNVKDTNITYRYDGSNWIAISANAIPKATQSVDGLLSKEDKKLYDDTNSKSHTHSNKSVLDGITAALIAAWNHAVAHITDTVKHITANERAKWNEASDKVAKIETGAQVNKVTGIKGNAESAYRTGNVNLTPANIGAAASGHTHSNYTSAVTTTGAGNAVTAITQSGNTLTAAKGTSFLPVTGGTLTGTMKVSYGASDTANTRFKQIEGSMAGSDKWGIASGASASDAGWMELYTEDNGNEPIYARQYTNTGTAAHQITLMDGSGNQTLNKVTASGGFVGSLSGNASTATKLQTARTINGTSFDGSGNITTANWGPSRNITIGNKQKSINGSTDLSYSLSDIGAAAASHTHTKSQISDFPASMKNPTSLTIQSNGVTLAAYDGSAAKTANIPLMKAATASAAGSPGLVPAPAAGSQAAKYLRADGTWQTPANTTYGVATESNNGLMSAKDKKLIGNTDISNIGNGTVTGAVAQLNSNLTNIFDTKITTGKKAISANIWTPIWTYTATGNKILNLTVWYTIVQASQISCRITVNGVIYDKQQMTYNISETTREFSLHLLKQLVSGDVVKYEVYDSQNYPDLSYTIVCNV